MHEVSDAPSGAEALQAHAQTFVIPPACASPSERSCKSKSACPALSESDDCFRLEFQLEDCLENRIDFPMRNKDTVVNEAAFPETIPNTLCGTHTRSLVYTTIARRGRRVMPSTGNPSLSASFRLEDSVPTDKSTETDRRPPAMVRRR